jgi:glutathione S-transferase
VFTKTGETAVTEFLRGHVKSALILVNQHLASRAFVLGAAPTIAGISMCGYLYWPDELSLRF